MEYEEEEIEEEEPVQEEESVTIPKSEPRQEDVVVVDYREDVKEYVTENNSELSYLEDATSGLLQAFKNSTDFYDGLRRLDAKTDIGRVFLELLTRFVAQYEKVDDANYKSEVVEYIKINTEELEKVQERVNYLIKAYDYADDFLYGIERLEPVNDISRAFVELLRKFVEIGLSDDDEE